MSDATRSIVLRDVAPDRAQIMSGPPPKTRGNDEDAAITDIGLGLHIDRASQTKRSCRRRKVGIPRGKEAVEPSPTAATASSRRGLSLPITFCVSLTIRLLPDLYAYAPASDQHYHRCRDLALTSSNDMGGRRRYQSAPAAATRRAKGCRALIVIPRVRFITRSVIVRRFRRNYSIQALEPN